jgi:Zn-dependent peptidase ImmA (M78 family)/DNA-binding XRE family transcriptional regulator
MNDIAISGERVRSLRLALDISQVDLANSLGLAGNSVISKVENGRVTVDDTLLHALAERLSCSTHYLLEPAPDVIATRPWLRAYADASAKTVDAVTADNVIHHEFVQRSKLRRVPHRIPVFDGDLNDAAAIDDFAEDVRLAAEIQEGDVVRNAMRAAERLGCIVLPLADELGRHMGMSQFIDGVPYIRVSRAITSSRRPVPGDRQRFTVIHEVGHLALHADMPPPDSADDARRVERQAHRFAAAFLLPATPLIEDLAHLGDRVTLTTLSRLKGRWGVAIKMLVKRFQDLGIIESDQATSLYKQISKRGWNIGEPVPVTTEQPIWFTRALERRARDGDKTWGVGRLHDLGSVHLNRWCDWTSGPPDDDTVVSLAARRAIRS